MEAIKDIPKINQLIKSLYVKTPRRKRKFSPTIHVGTKLTDVLSGRLLPQKYSDLGSPVITLRIGGIEIRNALSDLGETIYIITANMAKMLGMTKIQLTKTVLQLADQSTAKPEGVLEDVTITIDTWDYSVDFLVLKARKNALGYLIILGRPWLATTTSLIDCRSGCWKFGGIDYVLH